MTSDPYKRTIVVSSGEQEPAARTDRCSALSTGLRSVSHLSTGLKRDPILLANLSEADKEATLARLHQAVATTIRLRRIEADMSQDQVAYRLQWRRDHYIDRELGRRATAVPEFLLIARALKQPAPRLMAEVLLQYSREPSDPSHSQALAQVARRPEGARPRGIVLGKGALRLQKVSTVALLHRFEEALASVMRSCRRQLGLSYSEVGTRAGVGPQWIKGFEKVGVRRSVGLFIVVAPALGFTPVQLLKKVHRA